MILTKDRSFYKSLVFLAIPIALQNLITFAVTLADNVMVGTLGDTAISGVYIGSQIQTLLQIFVAGIEGAVLVLAAQYWGKRDTLAVKKIAAIGIRVAFFSAIAITLACLTFPRAILSLFADDSAALTLGTEYLRITAFAFVFFCMTQGLIVAMRSVEKPRIGLFVSLVSLVFNVTLNYILIFGKLGFSPMGVSGAAIATLISRIAEFLFIFVYVFFLDKKLAFRLRELFLHDRRLTRDFFKYGLPIMAGQLVWAINMFSYSAIMGKLDYDGVITALSVAGTLNSLSYIVMNGMSGAVGIITGKTIGAGKTEKIREYAYTVQIIFITGYSDYIAEGYEVAALHYLMKPVVPEKLFAVLDRAVEKQKQNERCLNLDLSGELVRIPFYEIRYLDVKANYVTVHGKQDYTVKRALADFEAQLDSRFARVGRSMIINLKYIRRVTKTEVHLSDGTVLELPRGAYDALNRAIITHT